MAQIPAPPNFCQPSVMNQPIADITISARNSTQDWRDQISVGRDDGWRVSPRAASPALLITSPVTRPTEDLLRKFSFRAPDYGGKGTCLRSIILRRTSPVNAST